MKAIASRLKAVAMGATIGLVGAGCDDSAGVLSASEAERVEVVAEALEPVSVTTQNGYVNELVPVAPRVRLLNDAGAPRAGVVVRFSVFEGGGRVSASRDTTDANGYAGVNWRLGPEVGRNRMRASVGGSDIVRFVAHASVRATIADVELTPGEVFLHATGDTARMVAHAFEGTGNPIETSFTWRSLNTGIATVDATGLVRAAGTGSTRVIAQAPNGVADTATITIEGVAGPPTDLLFASSFHTARGTTLAAVSDGGRLDFVSVQRGPNPNKEIVATTGLDFPMPNAYRVIATSEDGGWSELRVSDLLIPAVGEHRYYRWYYRLVQPDNLMDNDTHPIQSGGSIGASTWAFHVRNTPFQGIPAGTWALHWTVMGEANAGNSEAYRWYLGTEAAPTPLQKGRTYRIEIHFHRVSTTHYRLDARIYDTAGNLLYDANDFNNWNGTLNLGEDAPDLLLNNLQGMAVFNAGVNGIMSPAPFPFTYAYESGFCVRTADWCGAYNGSY